MNQRKSYAQNLMQTQVNEILDRSANQLRRVHMLEWDDARLLARLACAEVLTAVLDEADFYREETVTTKRLARLRDQLNPAIVTPGADR